MTQDQYPPDGYGRSYWVRRPGENLAVIPKDDGWVVIETLWFTDARNQKRYDERRVDDVTFTREDDARTWMEVVAEKERQA